MQAQKDLKSKRRGMYIYGSDVEPHFIDKKDMNETQRKHFDDEIAESGSPGIFIGHVFADSVPYPIEGPFPDPARPETHDESFAKAIVKSKAAKKRASLYPRKHQDSAEVMRSLDPMRSIDLINLDDKPEK
jgi:hypothetical protein